MANEINGHAIACDVSNHAQVKHVFGDALKVFGKVDVLVNNAGVQGPIGRMHEIDAEIWYAHIFKILNLRIIKNGYE